MKRDVRRNVIVFCDEDYTVDADVDSRKDGKFFDRKGKEIEVTMDEHKPLVYHAMTLTRPSMNFGEEGLETIYVDWKTLIPNDLEPLREMEEYAEHLSRIPRRIREGETQSSLSLMQKAYLKLLLYLERYGGRPTSQYKTKAMDEFMELFSKAITTSGASAIFPAYSGQMNEVRQKILQEWNSRENKSDKVLKAAPLVYEEFAKVEEIVGRFKLTQQERQNAETENAQQEEGQDR